MPLTRAGDKFLSLGSLIFSQVSGYCDEIWPLNSSQRPSIYHWRELPQVSFLSRQEFCCDKHVFVATKDVFCRDKHMRDAYFCRHKHVCVATKHVFYRDKSMLVTKLLSRQKYFVATNIILSPQNLSRQAYFCRDERRVLSRHTRVCGFSHNFVATKHVFCRDKHALVKTTKFFDKSVVASMYVCCMILHQNNIN